MTLFNHPKYHFTRGISIPPQSNGGRQRHTKWCLSSVFVGWRPRMKHELLLFRGTSLELKQLNEWRWGNQNLLLWNHNHISARRSCLTSDSRRALASREHLFWLSCDCDGQLSPRDWSDQRSNLLLAWYFKVRTICWLQPSCRVTTYRNNYGTVSCGFCKPLDLYHSLLGLVHKRQTLT